MVHFSSNIDPFPCRIDWSVYFCILLFFWESKNCHLRSIFLQEWSKSCSFASLRWLLKALVLENFCFCWERRIWQTRKLKFSISVALFLNPGWSFLKWKWHHIWKLSVSDTVRHVQGLHLIKFLAKTVFIYQLSRHKNIRLEKSECHCQIFVVKISAQKSYKNSFLNL